MTPDDVIKFWFGDELEKGTAAMETDEYKDKMNIRWFRRSDDFDNEARRPNLSRSPTTLAPFNQN